MKLVINKCYGGFSLSHAAVARYAELKGGKAYFFTAQFNGKHTIYTRVEDCDPQAYLMAFDTPDADPISEDFDKHYLTSRPEDRSDPDLIRVVEELGSEAASGSCAELKVINIPDGTDWELDEYDGIETVAERHSSWG